MRPFLPNKLKFLGYTISNLIMRHYELGHFKRYLKLNNIDFRNKRVLDVGSDLGYIPAIIIDEFRPSELFALNTLLEENELASQIKMQRRLFGGSIAHLFLPSNKFDAVFAFDMLGHVTERDRALREINRVLKTGVTLLLHEPMAKQRNNGNDDAHISTSGKPGLGWPVLHKELSDSGFRAIEKRRLYLGTLQSCLCQKSSMPVKSLC